MRFRALAAATWLLGCAAAWACARPGAFAQPKPKPVGDHVAREVPSNQTANPIVEESTLPRARWPKYDVTDGVLTILTSDGANHVLIDSNDEYAHTRAPGLVGLQVERLYAHGEASPAPTVLSRTIDVNRDGFADALVRVTLRDDVYFLVLGGNQIPLRASRFFGRGEQWASARVSESGDIALRFRETTRVQLVSPSGELVPGRLDEPDPAPPAVDECPTACPDCRELSTTSTIQSGQKLTSPERRAALLAYRDYLGTCPANDRLPTAKVGSKEDQFQVLAAVRGSFTSSERRESAILSFVGICGRPGAHVQHYGHRQVVLATGDQVRYTFLLEDGTSALNDVVDFDGDGVDELVTTGGWLGGGGSLGWLSVRSFKGGAHSLLIDGRKYYDDSCPWLAPKYWVSKVSYRAAAAGTPGCLSITPETKPCYEVE